MKGTAAINKPMFDGSAVDVEQLIISVFAFAIVGPLYESIAEPEIRRVSWD